ncbi:hypothetical protein BGZ82_005980 [Podila clonocystis]|nr:hypothetical protein BGZ82_005980 [Podila clonocystis]
MATTTATSTTTTTTTTALNGQGTAADLANGAGGSIANGPAGTTDVWSSLLNSVASSRLVPTKDVIILGDPLSGKSTLIELLKTAQPTPSSDPNADADKSTNGGLPNGAGGVNGNTGNGSAPVMVEMSTGTSEDNMFAGGQKKNDLALSYSLWNVEDEENEDTVARLGIYQIAGSHKSYHALLKYCLNTTTIADTVILIVLDWSRPWTFMETLQRWVKVLEGAIEQIRQEGAVATATWTKGKALMDELQEKLGRYLQEYTEPQPHLSLGSTTLYNESQTFGLGANDTQNVLLPLTDGCLTSNTGVPIVVVCTKSDHINNLERERDYQEETFDYIQQSLRTICLKYGASLFYTSIHHPHTFANLRQYLLHRLLTPSTLSNPTTPSSFPFKKRAQVVERDQVMVPAGWDSFGKIKVLRNGFDCEGVAHGWELDEQTREVPSSEGESNGGNPAGARFVYEDVITNPKLNHAPATIQPIIAAEDDQLFLDRFFDTLQRANERSGVVANMGGTLAGGHGAHGSASGPPVVGPLGSGYTSMLNSHHASPPPMMGAQSIGSAGTRANGYDSDDVEGRPKRLASKPSVKGLAGNNTGIIGPALPGQDGATGGLSPANMKMMMMMEQGRTNSGSPPTSIPSSLGGMAGSTLPGGLSAGLGRTGSAGGIGAGSASVLPGAGGVGGQSQNEAISSFFQSLMTRKGSSVVPTIPSAGSQLHNNVSNNTNNDS